MLRNKVMLITYHFPPSAASGAFRLLGFARHLPTFGWQPLVVAPPTLPWEPIDPLLVDDIPDSAIVHNVPYPIGAPRLLRVLAQNAVWLPRAWSACKRMIDEHRPDAIMTSGPPHCVHVLGDYLKRRSGLPWVADFRDPWISNGTHRKLGWSERWALQWERCVFANADLVLANAPNARRLYQGAHPNDGAKIVTLTNGYDPQPCLVEPGLREDSCVRLLHAGEIYAGRNPAPLFQALADGNAAGQKCRLQLIGRCESNDVPMLMRERGWTDFVTFEGQRDYRDTLQAMQAADILVLFDSPGRTIGVPAKLYEYLGARRPILALAESDGDTANILRASGVAHRIASPTDVAQIRRAVGELVEVIQTRETASDDVRVRQFTRENLTCKLADYLDALIGQNMPTNGGDQQVAKSKAMQEAAR